MNIQNFTMRFDVDLKAEVREDGIVPISMEIHGTGDNPVAAQTMCLVASGLVRSAGMNMGLEAALEEFNRQVMTGDVKRTDPGPGEIL